MDRALQGFRTHGLSDFDRKRIEKECASLAAVDSSGAHEIRACLAAQAGRFDEAQEEFERALKASDNRLGTAVRHLIILTAAGHTKGVLEIARNYRHLIRNDPNAIRTVSHMLSGCGWVGFADEIRSEAARLGSDLRPAFGPILQELKKSDLSETDVVAVVDYVNSQLAAHKAFADKVTASSVAMEDGSFALLFDFALARDPEEVADLEWELLSGIPEDGLPAYLSRQVQFGLSSSVVGDADKL
ncbi:hypothetical protein [Lysobacter sp. MMG2]|uniref:hypothetical protein n=1 Tax=Lysobacter sp. MMG2 TaxID=2801338 RepID=UPI001C245D90|nr:hypothetical protein [Lysobacter sp. MMG2]